MVRKGTVSKTGKSEKPTETIKKDLKMPVEPPQEDQISKADCKLTAAQNDPLFRQLEEAGEKLKAVLKDVREKANEFEANIETQATQAKKTVKKEISDTENTIRKNPFVAIGIAAGFGILVGLLINRTK